MSITTRRREDVAPSPLARCTGDPAGFLRDTWGRRASVRRGSSADAFGDLLTLDDVDRFLTTTALRTPFFRLVQAGERLDEASYTRSGRAGSRDVSGMTDPARVAALFEGGATIVLQGVHRWWEPVTRFCRDLELELGHGCQVNAYITPPGAQGLALHHDPHDVFVLQAFGRKRWEVHAAPAEGERPPLDVTVGPGDTVYLPTGTPHAASTQDELSGHLTVGVHVTTWRDVLADAWSRAATDPSLDEPVPAGWTRDRGDLARGLERRLAEAGGTLADVDARAVVEARAESFLSNRAQLARGTIVERSAPLTIDDDTVVRHRPGAVCEIIAGPDLLTVLLGDRRITAPRWLEPALRRIADTAELRVGDLADVIPDAASRLVLVRRLIREGLLTALPPPTERTPDPRAVAEQDGPGVDER